MTNKPEIKHKIADPYPKDVKMAFYDALFQYFNTSEVKPVDPDKNISDIIQSLRHCLGRKGYTITRAEPAAPSSDENVAIYAKNIEEISTCICSSMKLDLLANLEGLLSHIAALEADVLRLNGDCSNYLLVKMELEAENKRLSGLYEIALNDQATIGAGFEAAESENKRLREASTNLLDSVDELMPYSPLENLFSEVNTLRSALARTDGKVVNDGLLG